MLDQASATKTLNAETGIDIDDAKLLLKENLISGNLGNVHPPFITDASITPNGAMTLLKWKDELQSKSLFSKTRTALIWMLGVAMTLYSQIILLLIQKWIENK